MGARPAVAGVLVDGSDSWLAFSSESLASVGCISSAVLATAGTGSTGASGRDFSIGVGIEGCGFAIGTEVKGFAPKIEPLELAGGNLVADSADGAGFGALTGLSVTG